MALPNHIDQWYNPLPPLIMEIHDGCCVPLLPNRIAVLKIWITSVTEQVDMGMVSRIWTELDFWWNICHVMNVTHIQHLKES
jgi:hypothetical protein